MFFQKKKILVVDDDQGMLKIIEARLKHANFDVELAQNGEEAMDAMSKKPPKLVLLDIVMPGMDGFQVLEMMKKSRKTKSIPVIMITSKADDQAVQRAITMGARDYIVKPFSPSVMLEKVRKEIGSR